MDPNGADALQHSEQDHAKSSLKELHDHLDSLWITYLTHLDAYTTAQKTLQKHISTGFLALARANFNAQNGVRKYGKDYYHERAIATSRVSVSVGEGDSQSTVEIVNWSPPTTESDEYNETVVEVEKTGNEDEDVTQLPSPPGTPEPEQEPNNEPTPAKKVSGKVSLEADPLKWFGILIPQALRYSQGSFHAALHEAVTDAVNSAKGMRSTETEIRRLRKEIKRMGKQNLGHD